MKFLFSTVAGAMLSTTYAAAHDESDSCDVRVVAHGEIVSYDAIHDGLHYCERGDTVRIIAILDHGADVEEKEIASRFCDLRYQILQHRNAVISETTCILR